MEGELEMAGLEGKMEATGQKRKDNDDLDLALDALRDCDTDFSKFVQVKYFSFFFSIRLTSAFSGGHGGGGHQRAINFTNIKSVASLPNWRLWRVLQEQCPSPGCLRLIFLPSSSEGLNTPQFNPARSLL